MEIKMEESWKNALSDLFHKPYFIQITEHLKAEKTSIKNDTYDLVYVTVSMLDKDGNLVPNAMDLINFEVSGGGKLVGVDNGYQASLEPFKANYRKAFNGLCLAIIQAKEKAGTIKITATSSGLQSSSVLVTTK